MKPVKSIGVIGVGFVGNAVYQGMRHIFDVWSYDKKWGVRNNDDKIFIGTDPSYSQQIAHVVEKTDGPIFVCVPTPMNPDGSCNLSMIESVVTEIDQATSDHRVVIIKSTILPGTTDRLNSMCKNISVCFSPEFLTERSAVDDFKNQKFIIVGGPKCAAKVSKHMFQRAYPNVPCYITTAKIAEMVKYVRNCYLAVRVSFANEVYRVCEATGVDYDEFCEMIWRDEKMGTSHWSVPGHDGKFGFGGSCFPKDLNAFVTLAAEQGITCHTMKGAWETNLEVRPEKDWTQLVGRAVISPEQAS
jgi:UDPglucose 6-dehydrogenase